MQSAIVVLKKEIRYKHAEIEHYRLVDPLNREIVDKIDGELSELINALICILSKQQEL
jgi:hypothetical protein